MWYPRSKYATTRIWRACPYNDQALIKHDSQIAATLTSRRNCNKKAPVCNQVMYKISYCKINVFMNLSLDAEMAISKGIPIILVVLLQISSVYPHHCPETTVIHTHNYSIYVTVKITFSHRTYTYGKLKFLHHFTYLELCMFLTILCGTPFQPVLKELSVAVMTHSLSSSSQTIAQLKICRIANF